MNYIFTVSFTKYPNRKQEKYLKNSLKPAWDQYLNFSGENKQERTFYAIKYLVLNF